MRGTRWLIPALALSIIATAVALAAGDSLPRSVMSSGGGTGLAAGGNILYGTLGQPVAGTVSDTDFDLCSGFWCGPAASRGKRIYLPLIIYRYPKRWLAYLPLIARSYSTQPPVELDDAPDACPGYAVEIGTPYRDDFDQANDNDWFSFTTQPGVVYYVLETYDLESRADTGITLYDVDCLTVITENDDREIGDPSSLIAWTPPRAGTYHVLVRSYDWQIHGEETGYTFRISVGTGGALRWVEGAASAKPTPPPTPTPTLPVTEPTVVVTVISPIATPTMAPTSAPTPTPGGD